jgi:hypothetical protein
MPQELQVNPGTRVDEVGRTGIYPVSGFPAPGFASTFPLPFAVASGGCADSWTRRTRAS